MTSNWYRIAQNLNSSKVREYSFDRGDNIFYKILEREQPFQESDRIKVFHAFREMFAAVTTAIHGISGRDRAPRAYSYESNNNPYGLYVTIDLDVAKEFTTYGAIMEFVCMYSELETPVWPGGGYTIQGEMAQYWDADRIEEQREKARQKIREEAKKSEYEAIAKSSRPELAEILMSPREYQALFIGDLNPSRITKFWVRDQQKEYPRIDDPWVTITKEQLIEKYKEAYDKQRYGLSSDVRRRVLQPEDEFNLDIFVQKMQAEDGVGYDELIHLINTTGADQAKQILSEYVWPKQIATLTQWIDMVAKENPPVAEN